MNPILYVENMTGGYRKNRPIIHDVSFSVYPEEMVGLIGLNGAGKSTTIKHILGLLTPTTGTVRINGTALTDDLKKYRSAYSYVPENPLVYDDLTLREHLEFTAMAYGIDRDTFTARSEMLVDEFRMRDRLDTFPRHMSKGMRQKMMIMNAFLVQPSLYMIDEPFLGLDPLGIRSLLELMVRMKKTGAGILMSSHILSTVERYCDKFVVLHQGRVCASGTLADLRQHTGLMNGSLDDIFYELTKEEDKA